MSTILKKEKIKWFTWKPNIDLIAIIISWCLIVGFLSLSTFVITGQRGGLYFIFYALFGATLSGVALPVLWSVLVRRRKLSDLGINLKKIPWLILVQLVISFFMYNKVLFTNLPQPSVLFPLIALTLTIGFFEALYWRGFVLLRLEEMFGLIPALIIGSLLYSVYHIGYGMPVSEMLFLFLIGLMFAIVFRFTKSIFILWPFFQPLGQLTTLIKDGGVGTELPMIAVVGFGEALVVMMLITFLSPVIAKKLKNKTHFKLSKNQS